jgi:hypothetical protein
MLTNQELAEISSLELMDKISLTPPSRYTWPRYVLAAVGLFLVVCVLWTWKEVRRHQRIKRESQDAPLPHQALQTNQPGTNAFR